MDFRAIEALEERDIKRAADIFSARVGKGNDKIMDLLAVLYYSWNRCPSAVADVIRKRVEKELKARGYKRPKEFWWDELPVKDTPEGK